MEREDKIEVLVARAQQGDRAAFEAAIETLRSRLEGYVMTRIGGHLVGAVDMEDVCQETYAQALASLSCLRWRGPDSFLRWLNGIAEHVIVGIARQQQTHAARILYVERDVQGDDPAPSAVLRRHERFLRLKDALDRLPRDYRDAIRLTRIEGLPVKEAANRMERTPKAVMHLLARGLKRLRDSFGDTESFTLPDRRLVDPGEGDGA